MPQVVPMRQNRLLMVHVDVLVGPTRNMSRWPSSNGSGGFTSPSESLFEAVNHTNTAMTICKKSGGRVTASCKTKNDRIARKRRQVTGLAGVQSRLLAAFIVVSTLGFGTLGDL
jgi:hypothetical protein